MTARDFFDLLLIIAWCYGNGYLFAWFLASVGVNPARTAALFAFIGWGLGLWGINLRQRSGRFPLVLSFPIAAVPFLCTVAGGGWWLVGIIQRWLGLG